MIFYFPINDEILQLKKLTPSWGRVVSVSITSDARMRWVTRFSASSSRRSFPGTHHNTCPGNQRGALSSRCFMVYLLG